MCKVYTIGYGGRTAEEIQRIAEEKRAIVFDVRYSPRSRNAEFSGKRLRERLGDRYRHVRALGNANYKQSGFENIEIVDLEAGIQEIHEVLADGDNVILMCVCRNPTICHRTYIARELKARGIEVVEINAYQTQMM